MVGWACLVAVVGGGGGGLSCEERGLWMNEFRQVLLSRDADDGPARLLLSCF